MGSAARFLAASDPKLSAILTKMLDALYTPSEKVQKAVAQCLAPLMPPLRDSPETPALIKNVLERLKTGKSYGDRRGVAWGLSGVVKGLGISSLKQLGVMAALQNMVEDKKHVTARQGALFAFECLSATLGRLFEPYIIHILQAMLNCFADSSSEVREAAIEASRAIMGQMSPQGVKLILPGVLKGLEDRSWRTKQASIELVGAMAFCAPKQLSACLPLIVPRLINVLSDTHVKVQEAARESLSHIGSVVRNPEIQENIAIVIKALDDPTQFADVSPCFTFFSLSLCCSYYISIIAFILINKFLLSLSLYCFLFLSNFLMYCRARWRR